MEYTGIINLAVSIFHVSIESIRYTLFHEFVWTFFSNIIGLPERRNKRKCVLEITKMYYFKI